MILRRRIAQIRNIPARRFALFAAALLLLTLGVYARVARFDFIVIDDRDYITGNPWVLRGLTIPGIGWAFYSLSNFNWHPLTWISHMADVELFGLWAGGHHLMNLLLHGLNVLLLYTLLGLMTGAICRSAFVAALFAVHPLHVQSVAWVSERKDVLSGLFWLLTLLAYVRYARRPRPSGYALVLLVYALGLMTKPMLVTLPLVMLLLDSWPLGRMRRSPADPAGRSLIREKVPLFLLAGAAGMLTLIAQRTGGSVVDLSGLPIGARFANAALSYFRYLEKTVFPFHLAVYYPHPGTTLPFWVGPVCGILLVVLTTAAVRSARQRPAVSVGWHWYLITLLPVIGLLQVGTQGMADRYTYLPLTGIFVLLVWGVGDFMKRRPRLASWPAGIAALTLIVTLAIRAREEAGYWKNSLSLTDRACAVTGENFTILSYQGLALIEQRRLEEAIPLLRAAVRLNPQGSGLAANLASALALHGDTEEALKFYRQALEDYPRDDVARVGFGGLLLGKGDLPAARRQVETAIEISPENPAAHLLLARVFEKTGDMDRAIAHVHTALEITPADPSPHLRLGYLLALTNRPDEAIASFQRALAIDPANPDALFNIGQVYGLQGRREEAIESYRRALVLDSSAAEVHNNLGAALADLGRLEEALSHLREAARLQPDAPHVGINIRRVERQLQGRTADKPPRNR